MSRLSSVLLLSTSVLIASFTPLAAQADNWGARSEFAYQYELFVDRHGRRFLVDPDAGEVIGRANRNARFTRRDKIRAQRAWRRYQRRNGWQRDHDPYFDDDYNRLRQLRIHQRSVQKRGRFLDEYETDDMPVGSTRRYQEREAKKKAKEA